MADATMMGRTVLIAGASSGLGARFARIFAAAGARVILGARRVGQARSIAEAIVRNGGAAFAVALDVTDEDSVVAAFDAAEARYGTVDTIIANAGVSASGRSTEVDTAGLRCVFDTNLLGVFLTSREGAKRLIAADSRTRENGRIVIIGSITATMTGQGDAAYAASKAGVAHLARNFAREWVRQGINVNVVQPGHIRTELSAGWLDTPAGTAHTESLPRRRLLEPEALDAIILYLASDASRGVTGSIVVIDDGQSL